MAIKASTFEQYLKEYIAGGLLKNRPKTLNEYTQSAKSNPTRNYVAAIKAALTKRSASSAGYGTRGEQLDGAGLINSGYRERIEQIADERLAESVRLAEEKRADDFGELYSGYQRYLDDYTANQTSIKDKLRSHMYKNGIFKLEDSYALGIQHGLSAEEAASLSAEMYNSLRSQVIKDSLAAISASALDLDGIKRYAERSGLLQEDVDELVREARRYAVDYNGRYDDYIEYLENKANK